MVRKGEHFEMDSLSELGIFGTFLSHGSEVLINKEAGHLVRTKVRTFILPPVDDLRTRFACPAWQPWRLQAGLTMQPMGRMKFLGRLVGERLVVTNPDRTRV